MAPEGVEVAIDAVRLTCIQYPPAAMGDGTSHLAVAALPGGSGNSVLKMTAEMQHLDCESRRYRAFSTQANFAQDGEVVNDTRSHVTFMVRLLLLLVIWIVNQDAFCISNPVDSDQFLGAFSFQVKISVKLLVVWENGPGFRSPGATHVPHDWQYTGSAGCCSFAAQESLELHYNNVPNGLPNQQCWNSVEDLDPILTVLDHRGNPIEKGGRPWKKPTAPETQEKAKKRKQAKLKKLAEEALLAGATGGGILLHFSEKFNKNITSGLGLDVKGKRSAKDLLHRSDRLAGRFAKTKKNASIVDKTWDGVYTLCFARNGNLMYIQSPGNLRSFPTFKKCSAARIRVLRDLRVAGIKANFAQTSNDRLDDASLFMLEYSPLSAMRYEIVQKDHETVREAHQSFSEYTCPAVSEPHLELAFTGMINNPTTVENLLAHITGLDSDPSNFWREHSQFWRATHHWIVALTRHIQTLLLVRGPPRELFSGAFGAAALQGRYALRSRHTLECPSDLDVTKTVIDVIATWLNFPLKGKSRAQARFIQAVFTVVALQPCTWTLCGTHLATLRPRLSVNYLDGLPLLAAYERLEAALQAIQERFTTQIPLSTIQQPKRHRPRVTAAPPSVLIASDDAIQLRNMNRFLEYLVELEPLINGYETIGSPTDLQAYVNTRLDFLLPFREHGPSRISSRGPMAAFDPSHSKTRAGLFSGLIFEAVKTFFMDVNDWNVECEKFPGKSSEFFCNPWAYSKRKANRTVCLVAEYWDALMVSDCPDWEANTADGTYTFRASYDFLRKTGPTRFREIGSLAGFLLAADFCYAGAVALPTTQEVGKIIREINKGGVRGLELLGLVGERPVGRGKKIEWPVQGFEGCKSTEVQDLSATLFLFMFAGGWIRVHLDLANQVNTADQRDRIAKRSAESHQRDLQEAGHVTKTIWLRKGDIRDRKE
ncbi:hypothetical protein B0H14DRAFT_3603517 [Mycena olivaceomarginata]|nr:hypothetical protein B0H14DRAFT_3603517 [Mycena olivaceomarginata]